MYGEGSLRMPCFEWGTDDRRRVLSIICYLHSSLFGFNLLIYSRRFYALIRLQLWVSEWVKIPHGGAEKTCRTFNVWRSYGSPPSI